MSEWDSFILGLGDKLPDDKQWAWAKAYVAAMKSAKPVEHVVEQHHHYHHSPQPLWISPPVQPAIPWWLNPITCIRSEPNSLTVNNLSIDSRNADLN